ncbi:MAG: hypothetical protein ACOYL5_15390 [Phototrophicaceae bacterium]|jgi:hypothetical protein
MFHAPVRTVFDVITDFLATEPSPQQIIDYYMPDDLQARLDDLLDKNGEGELTLTEREELQEFLNADDMFSLLKSKMKLKLKRAADVDSENGILTIVQ